MKSFFLSVLFIIGLVIILNVFFALLLFGVGLGCSYKSCPEQTYPPIVGMLATPIFGMLLIIWRFRALRTTFGAKEKGVLLAGKAVWILTLMVAGLVLFQIFNMESLLGETHFNIF